MYRPSFENLTSDTEEMISEKKDLFDGSSSSSNTVHRTRLLSWSQSRRTKARES